jgi:hypothetical protein
LRPCRPQLIHREADKSQKDHQNEDSAQTAR